MWYERIKYRGDRPAAIIFKDCATVYRHDVILLDVSTAACSPEWRMTSSVSSRSYSFFATLFESIVGTRKCKNKPDLRLVKIETNNPIAYFPK